MVVFDPIKIVLTNYPDTTEYLESENNPEDPNGGTRKIAFSKEIYIEKEANKDWNKYISYLNNDNNKN